MFDDGNINLLSSIIVRAPECDMYNKMCVND